MDLRRLARAALIQIYPPLNRVVARTLQLGLRLRHKRSAQSDLDTVVVLGDYLDFGGMIESPILDGHPIVLVATDRYPFRKMRPSSLARLAGLVIVADYADDKRADLLEQLRPYDPKVALIQAGEFLVPMCNYLNREFGNKGNSEELSKISLDKLAMRDRLVEMNVSTIRHHHVASIDDAEEVDFWPVVVKPTVSTGSSGVLFAENLEDFRRVYDESKDTARKTEFEQTFIVEEYVQGRQFDVEGFVANGKIQLCGIVEEYYEGVFPRFDHCWYLFNVELPVGVEDRIVAAVQEVLDACGLEHGGFHSECRIDRHGNPRVLEFSNRMGGGFEPLVLQTTGNDVVDGYIAYMLDKPYELAGDHNSYLIQKFCDTEAELAEWASYGEHHGLDYSVVHHQSRFFVGRVDVATDEWQVMRTLMADLLGMDCDERDAALLGAVGVEDGTVD